MDLESFAKQVKLFKQGQVLPQETEVHSQGNFKTQQCKYFELGQCKNSVNCTYAHGQDDVRGNLLGGRDPYKHTVISQTQEIPQEIKNNDIPIFQPNEDIDPNGIAFDPSLLFYQLSHIANRLLDVYAQQQDIEEQLRNAFDYLEQQDFESAANILHVL